jgi:hypothetical protein
MNWKCYVRAVLPCLLGSPLFAQPELNVISRGIQGSNFVWEIAVTPDLVLAGGSTPMALEMGFRLTGSALVSATNINPTEWDTPNPGRAIFGWETLTEVRPGAFFPEGLQSNTATSEVFVAYGSTNFTAPGPKPFLRIAALGPGNGGSTISTIEWLGVYAVGHGRIAQLIADGSTSANFDIFAGMSTQVIPEPEPASATLLALGSVVMALRTAGRRSGRAASR